MSLSLCEEKNCFFLLSLQSSGQRLPVNAIRLVRDGTEGGHPGRLFLVGGLGALQEL